MSEELTLKLLAAKKRRGGRIEDWAVGLAYGTGPEEYVIGNIFEDATFDEGVTFTTSTILKIYEEEGIVETQNTFYTLGKKNTEKDGKALLHEKMDQEYKLTRWK